MGDPLRTKARHISRVVRVYLIVQLTLPVIGSLTGSPYFGWRMFSEVRIPPRVVLIRTSSVDTVSVNRFVGFPRGDLSYSPNTASQICRLVPDAILVQVSPSAGVLPSAGVAQEARCK
jgi:hypothetical protein